MQRFILLEDIILVFLVSTINLYLQYEIKALNKTDQNPYSPDQKRYDCIYLMLDGQILIVIKLELRKKCFLKLGHHYLMGNHCIHLDYKGNNNGFLLLKEIF